jgi:hypothetical protein
MLTLTVVGLLTIHHYGTDRTLTEGWTVGDGNTVELGYELVTDPGVFGHISTALGTLNFYDGELSWCAAGKSDIECGA